MQGETGSHVQAISLVVVHLREISIALFHNDVASGAGAVPAACVLQVEVVVERNVQERLGLAMLLIRKPARLELDRDISGQESHLWHEFYCSFATRLQLK